MPEKEDIKAEKIDSEKLIKMFKVIKDEEIGEWYNKFEAGHFFVSEKEKTKRKKYGMTKHGDNKYFPKDPKYLQSQLISIIDYIQRMPDKIKIADIGSGHGIAKAVMEYSGFQSYGLEKEKRLVEKSKKNLIKNGFNGDVLHLDVLDGDLDSVVFEDGTKIKEIDAFHIWVGSFELEGNLIKKIAGYMKPNSLIFGNFFVRGDKELYGSFGLKNIETLCFLEKK